MARPYNRDDGVPTRADMSFLSPAEIAIGKAMEEVERAGASIALTDAVTLLGHARDRVADHVEERPGFNDAPSAGATIKQRYERDCFLCCIAMAVGRSYDWCAERWGGDFVAKVAMKGLVGKEDIDHAFGAVGLARERDYVVLFILPEFATHGFLRNIAWGRRLLLQLRSKNNPGEYHIVYWDGAALHDPSNKRTYTWDEVDPIYVWLFKETRP